MILNQANYSPQKAEVETMQQQLNELIENRGLCNETQLSNTMTENMVVETQILQEQIHDKEYFEEKKEFTDSYGKYPNAYHSHIFHVKTLYHQVKTINQCCNVSFFSDHLLSFINYYQNYEDNNNMLEGPIKLIHGLFFVLKNQVLDCYILTQQESSQFLQALANGTFDIDAIQAQFMWLGTTSHTILAGKAPEDFIKDPQYQTLITQARYFNGEFKELMNGQHHDDAWLKENAQQK